MTTLAPVSGRRRAVDRGMRGVTLALTMVAVLPLVLSLIHI